VEARANVSMIYQLEQSGGERSLDRTRLCPSGFPDRQGKTGNFPIFGDFAASEPENRRVVPALFLKIP
jgi:hypothetical protein